jgi:ATP-dependent Lhr-like helicase
VENAGRILVEDAHGAPPSIPFWLGEAPGRTEELSQQVGELRQAISDLTPNTVPGFVNQSLVNQSLVNQSLVNQSLVNQKSAEVLNAVKWLKRECGLDDSGAEQAIEYIVTGRAVLGAVPTKNTIIAERFFDEGGGMQLVVHAPFGARINKAWGLSLRKRFCVSFNFELQAAATDNGVNIALAEQHSFPLADVFHFLHENTVKEVLQQAALLSPVFETRWRWDANRSLALLRYWGGKKVPLQVQRTRSADLLASVFPDVAACQENIDGPIQVPDHPLVREVMKDIFHEALDLNGLKQVLRQINSGEIKCIAVDTPIPSVFSHEILNTFPYAYLDDAPLEERRARAVEMRRVLPDAVLNEVGALDPAAIAQVRADAWPDVRDADELADVLHTLIALPERLGEEWRPLFEKLRTTDRATRARIHSGVLPLATTHESVPQRSNPQPQPTTEITKEHEGQPVPAEPVLRQPKETDESSPARQCWVGVSENQVPLGTAQNIRNERTVSRIGERDSSVFWVSAEKRKTFIAIYPDAHFEDELPEVEPEAPSRDDALKFMVTGWLTHLGPITASGLAKILDLTASDIEKTLLRIEASGLVLRGNFEKNGSDEIQWSERRLLARIHRLTLGSLRKQIEPVTAATFMRWLLRWQHVSPGSQVRDEHGALEVLRQLQGFEIPASAWERQILERRISNYDPKFLDQLCMTGAVGWGRLSAHPAMLDDSAGATRRVVPTSVAPITFFVRDEAEWLALPSVRSAHADLEQQARGLSPIAHEVLAFLRTRGASFFADIVRGSGKLKAEVETGLWELVAAGLVTADGFDNLRALIDPKRRAGHGTGKTNRPRHSAGRWSLLYQSGAHLEHQASNEAIEGVCRLLLSRYGVVFRELLARESILPRWRELLIAFRRLEDRGEIRGGRFITSFIGEQFALPIAVESLRAMRNIPPTEEIITISAADPLNLAGIVVPGERVPAISGKHVSFKDGVVVETPAMQPMAISGR